MAFTAAFIAHAPDADPEKTRALVETPKYKLFVVVVRNQEQAVETARGLVETEGVQSILLCPGFTNKDVADIAEAVGEGVGVSVARGDTPSNRIAGEIIKKEWG
jgi:Family of unknown function (DUF6506)